MKITLQYQCIALVAGAILCSTSYAGWVDDWFSSASIDGSSSYNNQRRGFYSAGGFRARTNTSNDYLVTASSPKLKSGCGGVDLFLGGISFLDSDYLVQKLQNMIQAAPAVAFDIALSTMSKQLSTTMKSFQQITSALNSLQLNDCAMTKTVIAEFRKDDPDVLGAVLNEMNADELLNLGLIKNYQQGQETVKANNGSPTTDLKTRIADCPADFKAIFAGGSVVGNAATRVGMGAYADIMRGYIGDVEIRAGAGDPIPLSAQIASCPDNDNISIDDMLYGQAYAKQDVAAGGTCYNNNTTSVISHIDTVLNSIATKMSARQALTTDEVAFIENSPVPVYSILRKAIASDNVGMTITLMSEVVGAAFTAKIVDDLYRNTDYVFRKVETMVTMPGVDPSATGNRCDPKLYAGAIERFRKLHKDLWEFRTQARRSYNNRVKEHLALLKFSNSHQAEEQTIRDSNAQDLENR